MEFYYRSFPNHIYFGAGSFHKLRDITKDYKKLFVIAGSHTTAEQLGVIQSLGIDRYYHFSEVVQHVPTRLVEEAFEALEKQSFDAIIAIGGGSAIGLAKALVLKQSLPIVAVPTTFSGSEQTNIWGISNEEGKTTGRDDRVLPEVVIYDPEMTATMPKELAVMSTMNAMAHLMEAVYAPDGNPLTRNLAFLGIAHLKKGLQLIADTGEFTAEANEEILLGAYLAGKCLCEVAMSLHHKTAHVLGGSFGMEHSAVHTVMQSYVLRYQWLYLPEAIQNDFISVLGNDPAKMLKSLAEAGGAKTNLLAIGFKEENIEKAAEVIFAKPYKNIAPITKAGLVEMLTNAFHGKIE
ncbi:MAG: maleylacetate reductase [Marivirga sp.]|jgi:maleylacetate reductase